MAWKTKKGRYRLHILCSGWTYDRRTEPDPYQAPGDTWNSALSELCIHLSIAAAGVAVLGGTPCEPST
jgi:hypothetical protein